MNLNKKFITIYHLTFIINLALLLVGNFVLGLLYCREESVVCVRMYEDSGGVRVYSPLKL